VFSDLQDFNGKSTAVIQIIAILRRIKNRVFSHSLAKDDEKTEQVVIGGSAMQSIFHSSLA
jgi:hypothetical protein